jgi:small nuclear ribonucleoprotein (snRNP)-like protein
MNFSINVENKTSFDSLKANSLTSSMITATTINSNAFLSPFQLQSMPQNSVDTTLTTGLSYSSFSGGGGWFGGVLAPNNKIYGIPFDSESVLIIDPLINTVDITTIKGLNTGYTTANPYKWTGGVLAPNGKIYGIPFQSSSVLIIDPTTNTADTTTITGLSGTYKWYGGVLALNGKIYCVPGNSTSVLIIDPATNTVDTTTITGLSGGTKWGGGVLAPNGKIYCMPYSGSNVLIIDPDSPIVNISALYGITVATATYTNSSKALFVGSGATLLTSGLLVGDNIIITTSSNTKYTGYIQSIDSNTSMTLVNALGVDLIAGNITNLEKTRKADITTLTGFSGSNKWYGGALGPNGKIYGIPHRNSINSVLIIDPTTTIPTANTTTITGFAGDYRWVGGVLGPNGKIYGIPFNNSSVLIIDPSTNTADVTTLTFTSSQTNQWAGGVLASNGKIYGIPYLSTSVVQIKTGLPSLPPWMLQAYYNKF